MARYYNRTSKIISAEDFRGLDLSEGEKRDFSSSVYMRNFRITAQRRLKKRCGYRKLISGIDADSRYACRVADKDFFIIKKGADLTALRLPDGTAAATATASDGDAGYFTFGGKAYIIGNDTLLSFDGVRFSAIEPYIPTVAVTADHSGGGTLHESLNLLTDKAKISYSPGGVSREFTLPSGCVGIVSAELDGDTVAQSGYTYSASDRTLTLADVPDAGVDSLVVTFRTAGGVPVSPGRRFFVYGGDFDSRVFAYGDGNTIRYSDITSTGSDPTYFPADNFITVGDGTYKVTALVRHFDRLVVFTERETWYISPSSVDYDGYRKPSFPIYPLNSAVGCLGGGAAFTDNFPVTLSADGIYRFGKTSIRDERNAVRISDRVAAYLTPEFLRGAEVLDCERDKELWCACGGEVLIYNYGLDVFYVYDGINAEYLFLYGGSPAFFDGENVYAFDGGLSTDDGAPYTAVYESGFVMLDRIKKKRRLRRIYVSLLPESLSSVTLTVIPNRGRPHTYGASGEIAFSRLDFSSFTFSPFTFECDARPEKKELRTCLSSFEGFKIRIENSRTGGRATVCEASFVVD